MQRYTNPTPTRERYPDNSIPGWLRTLRDSGARQTALSASIHGADLRTREVARERLDHLDAARDQCKLCGAVRDETGTFRPYCAGLCR